MKLPHRLRRLLAPVTAFILVAGGTIALLPDESAVVEAEQEVAVLPEGDRGGLPVDLAGGGVEEGTAVLGHRLEHYLGPGGVRPDRPLCSRRFVVS